MKRRHLLAIGVGLVGLLAGAVAIQRLYLRPRAAAADSARLSEQWIAFYRQQLAQRASVEQGLTAWRGRVLAGTAQDLDARLRAQLERIASGLGLSGVQVGTTAPVPVRNPIASANVPELSAMLRREAERGRVDFSTVTGDLSGSGTLDEVTRVLATLQSQPWVHRFESLSLRPTDKDRRRYQVRVVVSTILAPDLAARDNAEPPLRTVSDDRLAHAAAIAGRNPFGGGGTRSSPDPPAAQGVPAPGPALAEWRLVGVTQGRTGNAALLVSLRSGQQISLPVGGNIVDARLVQATGEIAIFDIGGQHFAVENGQSLEQRRPWAR